MLMNEEGRREGRRMRWLVDTHVRPLFEVMTGLYEYRNVHRLFGYLAERVFTVYLALQFATRTDFAVRSRAMMMRV